MENLFTHLEQVVLRMDSRFCTEDGHLLKNNVVEAALALDPQLLHYLLADEKLKRQFFSEVDGLLVFDKVKFQRFVMNKQFLPDSYTSFKNKVGLTNEHGEFLSESREVVLSWPYKDCMLEGGQTKEDAKRDEIFWNETLAPDEINRLTEPKAFTGFLRYDSKGPHEVTEILPDDNLIIKGNNLLALYSLRKRFRNSVKLIYIDPPYNTGNDSFGYNDSFNHSTWLTFMKNRLEVAKDLLRNDGVIAVHCDDNEQAYLKVLMDVIIGKEYFISCIVNQSATSVFGTKASAKEKTFIKVKDYILVYSKNNNIKINPVYFPSKTYIYDTHADFIYENGEKKTTVQWFKDNYGSEFEKYNIPITKEGINVFLQLSPTKRKEIIDKLSSIQFTSTVSNITVSTEQDEELRAGKIIKIGDSLYMRENNGIGKIRILRALKESCRIINGEYRKIALAGDLWNFSDSYGNISTEGGITMPNGKKPEVLLQTIIDALTSEGDLVLDFFGGSGTTAAVAHKMDRRYISCEQLESQMQLITTRLTNVIHGDQSGISKSVGWQPQNPGLLDGDKYAHNSFVYMELAQANQKLVDEIEAATDTETLQQIWSQMQEKGFMSYKVKPSMIDEHVKDFEELSLDDQKRFLIECLDKNLLYVPFEEMDDATYQMSEHDKQLTRQFYARR